MQQRVGLELRKVRNAGETGPHAGKLVRFRQELCQIVGLSYQRL